MLDRIINNEYRILFSHKNNNEEIKKSSNNLKNSELQSKETNMDELNDIDAEIAYDKHKEIKNRELTIEEELKNIFTNVSREDQEIILNNVFKTLKRQI